MTLKQIRYLNLIVSFSALFCCILTIIFVSNRDIPKSQNETKFDEVSYTNTIYKICKELIASGNLEKIDEESGVKEDDLAVVVGKSWQCGDWYFQSGGKVYKLGDEYRKRVITDIEVGAVCLDGKWCVLSPETKTKVEEGGGQSAAGGGISPRINAVL